MGQDPDAIRQVIAQTRSEMSETVEAVGYRTDVPSRAREAVSDKVDSVKSAVTGSATRAKENPLGLAIGAAAIGFLAGLAIPSTRVEDERLGPVADQVKDRVKETGQEALDRGKQVAQEVATTATETARQSAQEQGQGLADSAKQSAQEVAQDAKSQARSQAGSGSSSGSGL
jgi:hypothetical protein